MEKEQDTIKQYGMKEQRPAVTKQQSKEGRRQVDGVRKIARDRQKGRKEG